MSNFPPNLITYITNGFNVKTGDFVGAPIFVVPADSGQTVSFGLVHKDYAIPAGFMVDGIASFKTASENTLLHSEADFKAEFTLALSLKGGGSFRKIGLSAGLSGNLGLSGHYFHSLDEERFVSYAVQTVCQVERLSAKSAAVEQHGPFTYDVDGVTENFSDATKALSSTSTPSQWNAFFDTYGTHILIRGSLGGVFLVQTSTEKLEVQSDFAAEIGASMETGFNAKVASGSFDIAGSLKGSAYFDDVLSKAITRYSCRGGTFSTDVHYWVQSCFHNPVLVPGIHGLPAPVVASIAELFPTATQSAAEAALRQYLLDGHILDTPVVQNLNQAYVPEISSLVSANMTVPANVGGYISLKSASDNVAQQTVSNQQPFVSDDTSAPLGSLLAPIRAGLSYAAELSNASVTGSIYAYPMLNPTTFESAIGPAVNLNDIHLSSMGTLQKTSDPVSPPSDGILVVIANEGNDLNYGAIALLDQSNSSTIAATGCFSGSKYTSFSAPVCKNKSYVLEGSITYQADTAIAFYPKFYPLVGVSFGEPEQIKPGIVYPATTDGLLVGYLRYGTIGGPVLASLSCYSGPVASAEALAKSPFTASTSIDGSKVQAAGSVTKPVRRGEYFTAVLTQNSVIGSYPLDCGLLWYPLVPASE
jgi:hypothetical protein